MHACASGIASAVAQASAWDCSAQSASSTTTRECQAVAAAAFEATKLEMLSLHLRVHFGSACRRLDHSSTGRRIGRRTREVTRLCHFRGRRELARSILVLHQLALHTRPRDGWGSLIRTGSNAATSEQLNRPWDTPTAAPAGQTIDSACCNRRPSQRCGPPSSWRRSWAPRLD